MAILQKALAIVIAGPTASGKSHLALELAQACNGVIINADSVQLYENLPILSAQPTPGDFCKATHRLYGVLPGEKNCTAALWCEMVRDILKECCQNKKLPLITGGTGFYLKALMEGLVPTPPIPKEIRDKTIARCHEIGLKNLFREVEGFDPDIAKRLQVQDQQRVMRAWEVYHFTGKPLSVWQASPRVLYAPDYTFLSVYLNPPREKLLQKADSRLNKMIEQGALAEVKSLLDKKIPPSAPVFKALGALQLADYLEGLISLEKALAKTRKITHDYIKRQQTWFRHQLATPYRIDDFYCEDTFRYVQSVIKEFNY